MVLNRRDRHTDDLIGQIGWEVGFEHEVVITTLCFTNADEALGAVQILLEQRSLRAAMNRAYYAMFYAVLALLALRK